MKVIEQSTYSTNVELKKYKNTTQEEKKAQNRRKERRIAKESETASERERARSAL